MRGLRAWGVFALVLVAAACGGRTAARVPADCALVGKVGATQFALCPQRKPHGTLLALQGSKSTVGSLPTPGPTPSARDAGRVGHWRWIALAPDGQTWLAQWQAECEALYAFTVPLSGGVPRAATGEEDWATSSEAIALGWTTDGRAVVAVPEWTGCSEPAHPGVWLIAPDGRRELVRDAAAQQHSLTRARPASGFAARGDVAALWPDDQALTAAGRDRVERGYTYYGRAGGDHYLVVRLHHAPPGERRVFARSGTRKWRELETAHGVICSVPAALLRAWGLHPNAHRCAWIPRRPHASP